MYYHVIQLSWFSGWGVKNCWCSSSSNTNLKTLSYYLLRCCWDGDYQAHIDCLCCCCETTMTLKSWQQPKRPKTRSETDHKAVASCGSQDIEIWYYNNSRKSAGHHFIILPHCTNPICFPPWKRQCFYSTQGVDDSLINVTTTILASPSDFLGDIFRGPRPTILKWNCFCWCFSYHFSVVTRDELVPPYVTRGQSEWESGSGLY